MTIEQTSEVVDILTQNYQQYFKDKTDDEKYQIAMMWATMFLDEPVELVLAGVKRMIATDTKGYSPVVGQVKENIYKLTHPHEMTEEEAWAMVRKAIRHTGAAEEFAQLPEVLQRLVGNPTQLREWAVMEEGIVNSVVSSNFKRSYREIRAEIKEYEKLPSDVKQITDRLAAQMLQGSQAKKLLGGNE